MIEVIGFAHHEYELPGSALFLINIGNPGSGRYDVTRANRKDEFIFVDSAQQSGMMIQIDKQ